MTILLNILIKYTLIRKIQDTDIVQIQDGARINFVEENEVGVIGRRPPEIPGKTSFATTKLGWLEFGKAGMSRSHQA